jgi:hypothetical protein
MGKAGSQDEGEAQGRDLLNNERGKTMSKSQIEEIIAMLWTITWLLFVQNDFPEYILWMVGVKAAGDHAMAINHALKGQ